MSKKKKKTKDLGKKIFGYTMLVIMIFSALSSILIYALN